MFSTKGCKQRPVKVLEQELSKSQHNEAFSDHVMRHFSFLIKKLCDKLHHEVQAVCH